jgi:hypothetical protein
MHPLLAQALADAAPLIAERGWFHPSQATVADAGRMLDLVSTHRAPSVQIEPDGVLTFSCEAAEHGWPTLAVDGSGRLTHAAVIDADEFAQTEHFGATLPDWAATLLARMMRAGH